MAAMMLTPRPNAMLAPKSHHLVAIFVATGGQASIHPSIQQKNVPVFASIFGCFDGSVRLPRWGGWLVYWAHARRCSGKTAHDICPPFGGRDACCLLLGRAPAWGSP